MRAIWHIFVLVARRQRVSLLRGAALSVVVLLAGFALLSLSGWFITAAAAAGLAGVGAVFDVFRPSAAVRLLALGRTVARYGERLLTHDATLRALAELRIGLLARLDGAPYARIARLRGAQALNRLMADVDALDGIPLRLVLPFAAALGALLVAFFALWSLSGLPVALWVAGGYGLLAAGLIAGVAPGAGVPSRRAERAAQAFRTRFIDLIRARDDLAVYGVLGQQRGAVLDADRRRWAERRALNRRERLAGALLSSGVALIGGGALWIGAQAVGGGASTPALAALPVFGALALAEAVMPLRRALAEYGRMADAARRVVGAPGAERATPGAAKMVPGAAPLSFDGVTYRHAPGSTPVVDGFSMTLTEGEAVALTGPSGQGKSTLLLLAAGLLAPEAGEVRVFGAPCRALPEHELRARVTLLPQRSALMSGAVREALAIARPGLTDDEAWAVLEAVALDQVLAARGGLDFRLGEAGQGLSGGEQRRLALARTMLRRPGLLLLDEPTEGLDRPTAERVLQGIRTMLPNATILLAAHRPAERAFADRVVMLG